MNVERGDIVVYKGRTFLGETEWVGVVESVDGPSVDLGIDGVVPKSSIVEVRGKSPSMEAV